MITDDKKSVLLRMLPPRRRVAELLMGFTVNALTNWFFNFCLYPFVIYKFGIIKGGIVMIFLSFVACILTIQFYDWSRRDWLGIETIKGLKNYTGNKTIGRFTAWIMTKSEPIVFLFLSIWYDPFITTVYLRRGQYSGMSRRDWKLFIGSLFLGNVYWTLACYMGISLFEWGWKAICG